MRNSRILWRTFKIFFLRTTEPILTKPGTKHPWVMGIQVCSNDGPRSFLREDNNKIAKIHWQTLKILFSRIAGPISTKIGRKHSWVKGIQLYFNEGPLPFSMGDNKEIAKIHRWTLKNHRANFNQTWHKAFLGDEDSSFFKFNFILMKDLSLFQGEIIKK